MANPYFNATYYLQNNPDLIAAGINTVEGAWAHYVQFGAAEALQGAASRSPAPWFDIKYYLSQNADLVTSGLTAGQLFEHFVNFGVDEQRAPSAQANVNSETLAAYAAANADLREAFGIEEGAELTKDQEIALAKHFYTFGYLEPREGKPFEPSMNDGETFNLTTGADNIVGTTGDDTIIAAAVNQLGEPATTLQAFDSIDGGAGRDTLNIYANGGFNVNQVGTVKNVEVINIHNAEGQFAAAGIDASKFVGAEEIWQIGGDKVSDVNKLGENTVAGYKGIDKLDAKVKAADTVTTASASLQDVTTSATVAFEGKALSTVNLTGKAVDATGKQVATGLDVTAGSKVKTLVVNTAADVNLTLSGAAALTAINAEGSTGGIQFEAPANTTVTSVTTGSGNDDVKLGAFAAGTKTASVNTGAGNDKITIDLQDGVKYAVEAGAGDDTVTLIGTVKTTDSIDGGDGVDTVALKGQAKYVADDYIVLTKVLKNFEKLQFTEEVVGTADAKFDASKAAGYQSFTFDKGGFITKVAAGQTIITAGNLVADAAGFVAATDSKAATYAGSLDITATANATVTANAETVALAVKASKDAGVEVELKGDVKSATVALQNGVKADDTFTVASIEISQTENSSVVKTDAGLGGLTSLTLTGNGEATVTVGEVNGSYNLTTINAAGLNSVDADGKATDGLIYTSNNTKVETITLGQGNDVITLNASTYGATDVIIGFDAKADKLNVGVAGDNFKVFESTQTDLDLLLKDAAASADDNLVFQFGGDTYVFVDKGDTGLIEDGDTLVKLTGTINLDDLISALVADLG